MTGETSSRPTSEVLGAYDPRITWAACDVALRFQLSEVILGWSQVSRVTDFVAAYLRWVLQGRREFNLARPAILELRDTVLYGANELFENAVKFQGGGSVGLGLLAEPDRIHLLVHNQLAADRVDELRAQLSEIVHGDAERLFVERVERNADDAQSTASGLGLLSLINDYGMRLGWCLDRDEQGHQLYTMAAVDLKHPD